MTESKLIGTWSLESSENLNAFLKQLGMSLNKRKMSVDLKPTLAISHDNDSWCIAVDMKTKGHETIFREGVEIDTSNELKFVFDIRFSFEARRFCKSKFKFESPNKLIQNVHFTDTEEDQLIVREVNDDGFLVETLHMNGIVANRVFKRV